MIYSFQNVHENFFKLFVDAFPAKAKTFTDYSNRNFAASVHIVGQGGEDFVEAQRESYPQLIIQPFAPIFNKKYGVPDLKPYFADNRDTDNDGEKDTTSQFFEPLAMTFRYEVSVCAKNFIQLEAMMMWFSQNFHYHPIQAWFDFNAKSPVATLWGNQDLCDKVPYDFELTAEPIRSDGIKEVIYEFQLHPFINLKPVSEDLPLIRNIALRMAPSLATAKAFNTFANLDSDFNEDFNNDFNT